MERLAVSTASVQQQLAKVINPTTGEVLQQRKSGLVINYAECIAEIEEADRLGFDCACLSEHHGMADGFLPAPLAAAALAAKNDPNPAADMHPGLPLPRRHRG